MMLRKLPSPGQMLRTSLVLRFLPKSLIRHVFRDPGAISPNPKLPYVLLLRPFMSEQLYFFSSAWCAAAVYQFGQPVLPTEIGSAFWRREPGFVMPGQAAWKRSLYGYDRIFTEDTWSFELADLVPQSALAIVDISEQTTSIVEELIILSTRGKIERLICIYERERMKQTKGKWEMFYSAFNANNMSDVSKAIDNAIPYSFESAEDLNKFWTSLVMRCASLLGLKDSELPHPKPPPGILTNANAFLAAMKRANYR